MQHNIFEIITFIGGMALLFSYIYKTDFQKSKKKQITKTMSVQSKKRTKRKQQYKGKVTNKRIFENDYTDLHVEAMWDELTK